MIYSTCLGNGQDKQQETFPGNAVEKVYASTNDLTSHMYSDTMWSHDICQQVWSHH